MKPGWREKLSALRAAAALQPELAMVFSAAAAGAPKTFLHSLAANHRWLPSGYLDFLRETDGASLDFTLFGGSGHSTFPSLSGLQKTWAPSAPTGAGLVIGQTADSGIFLAQDGHVLLFGAEPSERPSPLADSFDSLLGDVLMGEEYLRLYPRGTFEDNAWLGLLERNGWLSKR